MNSSYQSAHGTIIDEDMFDPEQLEHTIPVNKTSYKKPLIFGLMSFVCVAAAMLALLTTKEAEVSHTLAQKTAQKQNVIQEDFVSSVTAEYTLTASNPTYGEPTKILEFLPWSVLVEPHQDQTLTMSSLTIDGVDVTSEIGSTYSVAFTIDDVRYQGSPATVFVETVGVLNATVAVSKNNVLVSLTTVPIAVKYIRREIRSLTESDRNKWINAMKLLYTTSLDDGKALYGDDFYNAEWFSYQHLNGAGRNDCDHWHDGAAVATIHLSFTLICERALQSIDPSISMPYWEYAHDYLLYDSFDESAIFGDDWLGVSAPTTSDYSLQTGVFANIPIPDGSKYLDWDISKEGSLNPFVNAYGWLRSPWNNNPAKYISRHDSVYGTTTTTMPDCKLMSACYNSGHLSVMNDCLNGVTHGPVHILIGGCWGEGDTLDGVSTLRGIDKLLFFKMLWRMGYTRCPTSCTYGEPCSCAIPEEYYSTIGAMAMLNNSGVLPILYDHINDHSEKGYEAILKGLQDPASVGEMFSSMASFDPTFWPLHGQMDRIMSRKRAQAARGILTFDDAWGWESANDRYTMGVCDWSGVSSPDDLTLPVCDMGKDAICVGHGQYDSIPFVDQFADEGLVTNQDMFDYLHPWNEALPYVYDTLDFDYCVEEGFAFN